MLHMGHHMVDRKLVIPETLSARLVATNSGTDRLVHPYNSFRHAELCSLVMPT